MGLTYCRLFLTNGSSPYALRTRRRAGEGEGNSWVEWSRVEKMRLWARGGTSALALGYARGRFPLSELAAQFIDLRYVLGPKSCRTNAD